MYQYYKIEASNLTFDRILPGISVILSFFRVLIKKS